MNKVSHPIFADARNDFLLILAPFLFGTIYLLFISLCPNWHNYIFGLAILFGAEWHFASTYFFFTNIKNWPWIKKKSVRFFLIPLIIVPAFIILGLSHLKLAFWIISVISGFHVTRQSIGILRIYNNRDKINEWLIYLSSFFSLGIFFLRFYKNTILIFLPNHILIYVSIFLVLFDIIMLLVSFYFTHSSILRMATFTGTVLYLPYCFFNNPMDAMVVCLSIHWSQYIAINYAIYGRQASNHERPQFLLGLTFRSIAILIFIYAAIMSSIETKLGTVFISTDLWVLIPLSGQLLHFYVDAFIWRFSDSSIKQNVGRLLFASQ